MLFWSRKTVLLLTFKGYFYIYYRRQSQAVHKVKYKAYLLISDKICGSNENRYQVLILESTVSFAMQRPAGFVNFCFLQGKACFLRGRASILGSIVLSQLFLVAHSVRLQASMIAIVKKVGDRRMAGDNCEDMKVLKEVQTLRFWVGENWQLKVHIIIIISTS